MNEIEKMKICCSWSGGKDSAMMLHKMIESKKYEIISLFTTISEKYERISMHGVRTEFLVKQSREIGIPIDQLVVSSTNYGEVMEKTMNKYIKDFGVKTVSFGDLYLEDVRKYREEKLSLVDMKPIFPLWGSDEEEYYREFVKLGFKAIITCVDSKFLGKEFVGEILTLDLLEKMKELKVSVCGENGEYHSFVFDGPIFKKPIEFKKGEIVFREERFYYIELLPVQQEIE